MHADRGEAVVTASSVVDPTVSDSIVVTVWATTADVCLASFPATSGQ